MTTILERPVDAIIQEPVREVFTWLRGDAPWADMSTIRVDGERFERLGSNYHGEWGNELKRVQQNLTDERVRQLESHNTFLRRNLGAILLVPQQDLIVAARQERWSSHAGIRAAKLVGMLGGHATGRISGNRRHGHRRCVEYANVCRV